MKKLKRFIYLLLDRFCPMFLHRRLGYSQEGEDLVVASFFEGKENYKGFFVDVGAHHPYRFSNTAFFYKQGWRGINIEPTPSLFKPFLKFRKRDINLNYGIGNGETLTFYVFNEGAINTFDEHLAKERDGSHNGKYKIVDKIPIKTMPLSDILDRHLPQNTKIDLLTIDVEGMDYLVLQSNDWSKYTPDFILVECEESISNLSNDCIYQFLHAKGYSLVGRTKRTSLFRRNKDIL